MRWDSLYVAGIGTYLPEREETVEEAVASGRYSTEKQAMNGYRAVRIAEQHETGPVMAVTAARQAVARSGVAVDQFGVVLHSYVGHQGFDMWTPASFVQRETIGGNAPAFEIKQGCNGFMVALEAAASYISVGRPGATAALVTGGDSFRLPYIDRWASHDQNVDGDGAGAVVLSTRGGFARIRATYSYGDPTLEPMARPAGPWTDTPFPGGRTLEFANSKRNEAIDLDDVVQRVSAGVQHSLKQVLHDAEVELSDVTFFLHQQLAETIAVHGIYGLLGVDRATTAFDWGKDIGMVGSVDLVLGLNHVLETRNPKPGDLVVLQGAGAGYVWTTAVLEILEPPTWT